MAKTQNKEERQRLITEFVLEHGSVKIDELLQLVSVSPMTLYRDLHDLEAGRTIDRFRGEVTAVATTLSETSMRYRMEHDLSEKAALAQALHPRISRGMSVLLDDSSTAYSMISSLVDVPGLTVITNSWRIMQLAIENPKWELITIGGQYDRHLEANFGPAAIDMLGRIRADVGIVSAAAVIDGVVYHPYENVAEYKDAMRGAARTSYLAATTTKFQRSALYRVSDTADYDAVLVEHDLAAETVSELEDRGATVLQARA
ncbi:MAG: DeoR/GlpR family DNA-binding transcription regulator [Ancrocorticia sp.]|uniref:DeoR/GlpR family DNA-binding transcription regulator n=1 Tax=Ancrocorticia sp. TaxID=2593684 RepID=UPI003F93E58F